MALRHRIDHLLARVREARAEIVERGLSAVHPAGGGDGAETARPCERPASGSLHRRRGSR